jgi:hypothetical protein
LVRIETSGESKSASNGDAIPASQWLAENAVEDELPADLSAQTDHYLYGKPERV